MPIIEQAMEEISNLLYSPDSFHFNLSLDYKWWDLRGASSGQIDGS